MAKYLDDNGLLYLWTKLKSFFVAKVAGKDLSTNDLTNTLKTNYDAAYTHSQATHAPTNAEQNVQADWGVSDSGSDAFIKNKPAIPTVTNDLTNALKTNYDAAYTHSQASHAPATAEQNVQADWNVVDTASDAFIKNKPTIPSSITVDSALSSSSNNPVENHVIKAALHAKIESTTKGQPNGVASLDAGGLIPSTQLPSFVDDVLELLGLVSSAPATCATGDLYYNTSTKLIYKATGTNTWGTGTTPAKSIIYVDVSANGKSYRWGGTDMVLINSTDLVTITNAEIDTIVAS